MDPMVSCYGNIFPMLTTRYRFLLVQLFSLKKTLQIGSLNKIDVVNQADSSYKGVYRHIALHANGTLSQRELNISLLRYRTR